MKTLGILGKQLDESYVFNNKYLNKFPDVNCMGLFPGSDYSLCDGFFIQGGKNIEPWFYDVIKHAIQYKKPVLGICLGCQILGTYGNGNLKRVNNHLNTFHDVFIDRNSFLFELFGDVIKVNSRHEEAIDKLSNFFDVIAVSSDGIIEAIRYKDLSLFIVGIQWHPEDIVNMNVIFDKFMSEL